MATFWRRGTDNLKNGTILGGIFGLVIVFGQAIYDFFVDIIPESWIFLGSWSIPVYLVLVGALLGYIIDRS